MLPRAKALSNKPCGHVVTGDLSKLRNLIRKGPENRMESEQENYKETVSRYTKKWRM